MRALVVRFIVAFYTHLLVVCFIVACFIVAIYSLPPTSPVAHTFPLLPSVGTFFPLQLNALRSMNARKVIST